MCKSTKDARFMPVLAHALIPEVSPNLTEVFGLAYCHTCGTWWMYFRGTDSVPETHTVRTQVGAPGEKVGWYTLRRFASAESQAYINVADFDANTPVYGGT